MFKKEKFFVALKLWLYEKQLGSYGGMSHSPRCCVYVKTLLFSFCVYVIKGVKRLPRSVLSKQNGMSKNRYKHFGQPGETVMRMRMYQFKLTKS